MRRLAPIVIVLTLVALALLGVLTAAAGATDRSSGEGRLVSLGEGKTVEALAIGFEGALWFAGADEGAEPGNFVGRISSAGKVTEWPLPESGGAPGIGGLVRGPEGNMWLTEPGAERIAWVTSTGRREWFVVPKLGSHPTGIVATPGGFVWVTMEGTDRLAQIQPSTQTASEISLPAGTRPAALAFGSDSALWALESQSASVLRASLGGSTTTFPLPSNGAIFAGTVNSDIVAGAEGNLWLSQSDGPYVGEISKPSGAQEYTRYRVPMPGGTSLISTGPNGDIWFASGNQIGSISPRGKLGAPACAAQSCAGGGNVTALAEGPEGALWFALGNRIGRFTPPPTEARLVGRPAKVRGRQVTIALECQGGAAEQKCAGRLVAYGRQGPKRAGPPLAKASFKVLAQERKKVKLRLDSTAAARLRAAGSLPVQFVLKQHGKIPAGSNYTLRTGK